MTVSRGRFITLEGGEGVGKSTQAAAIADALRSRGRIVVVTREPGGTAGAELIRSLLMDGAVDRWSARTEAVLFAAARTDHTERIIMPALVAGRWVVCDRYVDSTRAYQGGAGAIGDADILALHAIGGAPMPDRTLLLGLDADEARRRVNARDGIAADRYARRGDDYHARLADAFAAMAAREPGRFRTIDAGGATQAVTDACLAALGDL